MAEDEPFVKGSRACRLCGATIVDGLRPVHMKWHASLAPLINKPAPQEPGKP